MNKTETEIPFKINEFLNSYFSAEELTSYGTHKILCYRDYQYNMNKIFLPKFSSENYQSFSLENLERTLQLKIMPCE